MFKPRWLGIIIIILVDEGIRWLFKLPKRRY